MAELGGSWAGLESAQEGKSSECSLYRVTMRGEDSHQSVSGAEPGLVERVKARQVQERGGCSVGVPVRVGRLLGGTCGAALHVSNTACSRRRKRPLI